MSAMNAHVLTRAAATATLVATILATAACGDDEGGTGGGTSTTGAGGSGAGAGGELRFATYNAGLAYGFVGYAEERAPLVPGQVAALPVDVLCVNEVWDAADVQAMKQATASTLPSARFFADSQVIADEAACEEDAVQPLIACVEEECGNEPSADCVLSACGPEFAAQTGDCQQCLAANVGGSIDDINGACTVPGPLYAYEGAFGVGLLTNQTVLAAEDLILEGSTINRRGVQYAELETAFGDVHVFCTHLTANLSIDYPREEGSWEAEQLAQLETILGWIGERAGDEPVVFLGDLNTGPRAEGISAELPANYERLVAAGFAVPFVEQVGTCTYCASNPLVGSAGDDTSTVLIDHVAFQRAEGTFTSSRLLDGDVTIQSADDGEVVTKLSDHFGVGVVWSR